jgi:mRNA-degrading endonuclease RelE of RelBE toxin-antitoxin system
MFTFIETKLFSRLVQEYLSDVEYSDLQQVLMKNPEAGSVIPGSGGIRKLRWKAPGRGKRGGYRVIYLVKSAADVIWLLTMYPKNVADTISVATLRRIRQEIDDG